MIWNIGIKCESRYLHNSTGIFDGIKNTCTTADEKDTPILCLFLKERLFPFATMSWFLT